MVITGAIAVKAYALASGRLRSTVERMARALREKHEDLWLQSLAGGGKAAPRLQAHHHSNLLLGFGSAQPSEAPAMVAALRPLVYGYSVARTESPVDEHGVQSIQERLHQEDFLSGRSLGQSLDALIFNLAHLSSEEREERQKEYAAASACIKLHPESRHASLSWWTGAELQTHHFGPAYLGEDAGNLNLKSPLVENGGRLQLEIVLLAAELLAGTLASSSSELPLSPSDTGSGSSQPENENAEPLAGGPAPTRNQDALPRDPGGVTRSEYAGVREKSQPPRQRGLATPLSKGKVNHGPYPRELARYHRLHTACAAVVGA